MKTNFKSGAWLRGAVTIYSEDGVYGLVDCNSFYCSCERVFRPELWNRPVVVLSNNDGCVISRSAEAKELGIKMGEPAFLRKDFFAVKGVSVFSSNYALYGDMSRRVMNQLGKFSPAIEVYSIDEAFIGFAGFAREALLEIAQTIKKRIPKNTGIPVSVGIGPTKVLAKAANHLAKKKPEYSGVFIIDSEETRKEALRQIAVEDVWGIGPAYSKKLQGVGVTNAWELSKLNSSWVRKNLTVVGARILYELNGFECSTLVTVEPAKKTIAIARSFSSRQNTLEALEGAVATYATRAARKLREQNGYTNLIRVFIHTDPFATGSAPYGSNIPIPLPVQTQDTREIVHYALRGLRTIFKPGYEYKKAGIVLDRITTEKSMQSNFFDPVDREREARLTLAIDAVNARFGKDKVKLAVSAKQNSWSLRQENLSPRYTTRWEDILHVLS
ncbi:Y-family DNA polymerase [Leptospira sanjuanensis]|uniref:Y-family DNA polymerase n=1 Tax=Leptospira sanjuanensis TaxID=2879643 RepID=UPI001EE96D6A|nr:Y-family DNA polymerase [Leptospira sanjuanensis]MCG6170200.1 Y-family DNA polymerase [Leptospira sanjuanensis]